MRQIIRKSSRGGRLVFGILPLLILAGLFLWSVDGAVRPAVESLAEQQAKNYAARCVSEAMSAELERGGVSYNEIVVVTRNTAGEVASVQTDMAKIGRLQTRLTQTILNEISGPGRGVPRELQIPLGTLFGNQLLAGRGPLVNIRLTPADSVETQVYHQFLSAGINQTLHRVVLEADMRIQALLPGYTITTDAQTSYVLAETVIVGNVPEGYTQINDDGSTAIQRFNDFKAETTNS